jgi:3-methyladenine DNA glycosylase AlkD
MTKKAPKICAEALDCQSILKILKKNANPKNVAGMARFGINPKNTYGISIPILRDLARIIDQNHPLALELWKTEKHEARLLAGFIDDPKQVTEAQMESWVKDFDSWDICDQVCSNLFDKTPFGWEKALEWPGRNEEFVRRAGFVLMAALSVHDKKAKDSDFLQFFPLIKKHSIDNRNFVRKSVNWALRQIGKRNISLNKNAITLAAEIQKLDSSSARWIANDALKELTSDAVQKKLKTKKL